MKANRIVDTGSRLLMSLILAVSLSVAAAMLLVPRAFADSGDNSSTGLMAVTPYDSTYKDVTVGDFSYRIYFDNGKPSSIMITKYTGNATELIIPTSFVYEGTTYPGDTGELLIGNNAFAGNTNLQKVAIPDGIAGISNSAFEGCTGLTEVAIGDSVEWIADGAFAGCSNLKTYLMSGENLFILSDISGIGTDANGNAYEGVTIYTVEGSSVIDYADAVNARGGNQITVTIVDDPYSMSTIEPAPEPATPYSPGASAGDVDDALTHYSSEADPEGTAFCLLQAKIKKVTEKSLTLTWKKSKKAKKYVIYGNKCGKTNTMKKLLTLKGSAKPSKVFKKVAGNKVKKGTYYKFVVVALDKNKKVISTSKIVHAITKGNKNYCNDKKVTTAAEKNKVAIKKGKTFKLKAKAIPADKGKTVKQHRKIAYESTNEKVATVNNKGAIKGMKKGTCNVFAYAQNGVFAKVKVTVK